MHPYKIQNDANSHEGKCLPNNIFCEQMIDMYDPVITRIVL